MHLKWDVKMDKGKYQQQKIDGIRNEEIRFKVVVATIDEKWWEESLDDHVKKRVINSPMRKNEFIQIWGN